MLKIVKVISETKTMKSRKWTTQNRTSSKLDRNNVKGKLIWFLFFDNFEEKDAEFFDDNFSYAAPFGVTIQSSMSKMNSGNLKV